MEYYFRMAVFFNSGYCICFNCRTTVSFWDAGEYILSASKLNVGHPPGAPLFQMLGAFFSIFAIEPSQIGYIMNLMSGVSSAFTILFMFWSISLLLTKVSIKNEY